MVALTDRIPDPSPNGNGSHAPANGHNGHVSDAPTNGHKPATVYALRICAACGDRCPTWGLMRRHLYLHLHLTEERLAQLDRAVQRWEQARRESTADEDADPAAIPHPFGELGPLLFPAVVPGTPWPLPDWTINTPPWRTAGPVHPCSDDDMHSPLDNACPLCKAAPGTRCISSGGGRVDSTHLQRRRILVGLPKRERLPRIPNGVTMSVPCGYCGAAPGELCRNLVGGPLLGSPHAARTDAARAKAAEQAGGAA